MGRLPVLCLRSPPEDPHRHAHHHLQQDPSKPQQHVEVRQAVPHHSGEHTLKVHLVISISLRITNNKLIN